VKKAREIDWDRLRARPLRPKGDTLGYADFFPERHKRKMLELAELRPSDAFFDLGCGNASILIYAVKHFHIRKAVGIERNPVRYRIAHQHVEEESLTERITILNQDKYESDLSRADVVLSMHPEHDEDYDLLFSTKLRSGARLIKHDLPLLGFDYEAEDYPFYLMRFPVKRMKSPSAWASRVLGRPVKSVEELWWELIHYQYEKAYNTWDIRRFDSILKLRM